MSSLSENSKLNTMQETIKPTLVEKKIIQNLAFKNKIDIEQHPNIHSQIEKATKLGNSFRRKVSILFHADSGLKRVDTTIWANGSKYICLKGGIWIPKQRIVEIKV